MPEMPLTSEISKIYITSNSIIRTKRKINSSLVVDAAAAADADDDSQFRWGPHCLGQTQTFPSSVSTSTISSTNKERKNWGSNLLSPLSLPTFISPLSPLSLIRVCLYLYDFSSSSCPFYLDFSCFLIPPLFSSLSWSSIINKDVEESEKSCNGSISIFFSSFACSRRSQGAIQASGSFAFFPFACSRRSQVAIQASGSFAGLRGLVKGNTYIFFVSDLALFDMIS